MNILPRLVMSAAVALALAGHGLPAHAQAPAPAAPADADKALAEARAELARAARRMAELSRDEALSAEMAAHRIAARPVLGVLLAPDEGSGVRVAGVTPGSGAASAGLRPADRIVSVDGRQVLGSTGELRAKNLRSLLGKLETGKPTRIGYVRDGKPASVQVTPQPNQSVYFLQDDGSLMRAEGDVRMRSNDAGELRVIADRFVVTPAPGVPSQVNREIIRIGPGGACKGNDCAMPALLSAFRWNGLNLATVDKQLGRYFGTDHGVLVLSTGDLAGLQAGDVIQRIDGKPVASPREAMAAMGDKPGGAKVTVDYLRDRRAGKAQVTVPELAPLPLPPVPPAPPKPPKPPKSPAPPAPQAMVPALPPGPPAAPPPPAPPAAPDGAGTLTVVAGDTRSVTFTWQASATPADMNR